MTGIVDEHVGATVVGDHVIEDPSCVEVGDVQRHGVNPIRKGG